MNTSSKIINADCFDELPNIESGSISLILIDPPYLISKSSGFSNISKNTSKDMATKYGDISIDFGDWDKSPFDIDSLFKEYYRVLKKGGTFITFFDVWKSNEIKESAISNKFKQPRIGMWVKNNPVPINSKVNYLSNSVEFFFSFIKGGKPTFNSEYDNGIYNYPLCHGKERYDHPTQKPLGLISDLVEKHSNVGDLVLDTFAGTGTTGEACSILNRNYILIERDENYFNIIKERLAKQNI